MATPALARYGSDALKREFLAPAIAGELVASIAVTEPGAGSDVANIRTSARKDGDDYIINGSKTFITTGNQCDFFTLLCNTSDGDAHTSKSLIIVPANLPGVDRSTGLKKMGLWSSDTATVFFDDVRVPQSYRIGGEGAGFMMQMQQFQEERLCCAAAAYPVLEKVIEETISYTQQRQTFNKPIIANQVVQHRLVEMMTGRAIDEIYPKIEKGAGEVLLTVEGLKTAGIHDAFFDVRAGEVLGVAGLVGSGKSRLFRTVMGLTTRGRGTVKMRGKDISHAPTRDIIKEGIYYLSPDRKGEGLDLAKPSKDNLAINLVMGDKVGGDGQLVKWSEVNSEAATISNHVELHEGYRNKPVSQLSGGNQQKVLFGKCFGQNADIIIFDEPTVGVDMGTRAALYLLIKELAESGKAVVVISSDLPEAMNLSHRMIVLAHGHISAELSGTNMTEEQVLKFFFDETGAKL